MSGHSLKLHFCIFKGSQGKHNSLNYHIFLEYFPLIAKFICSKLDTYQKCFCMFKDSNLKSAQSLFFSNAFFSYQMCTIPSKIGEGFNIDDYMGKRT